MQVLQNITRRLWKANDVAPRIHTFAWRLIRRALPTGKRVGKHSKKISTLYATCGIEEDDLRMFFKCPFARATWFARPWHIKTYLLVQTSDSLTTINSSLAKSHYPHATLSNIITFLWGLWKPRNDNLFQRKMFRLFKSFLQHMLSQEA